MSNFYPRLHIINKPFAAAPYAKSHGYFKICWFLAGLKELVIEEPSHVFIPAINERIEIYTLVWYIFNRRRGLLLPSSQCNCETFYQTFRLHRMPLI